MRQKRLSYQALADKLGKSEREVVNLVTGNSSTPGPALQNVAQVLGMKNPIPHDGKHGA